MSAVTTQQAIDALAAVLPKLEGSSADFGNGLMTSLKKYGVTPGRWSAIQSLQQRVQAPAPAAPDQASVGDFHKVFALMAKAGETLKMPKIRLQLGDKSPIVLAIAGPKSQHPGTINVSDGGSYGFSKWYGRVDKNGNLTTSPKILPPTDAELAELLKKLGEAPAKVAAEYGRLTGRCCFCGRHLEDEQSTAAGFGPKCAINYGLVDLRLEALPTLYAAQQTEES